MNTSLTYINSITECIEKINQRLEALMLPFEKSIPTLHSSAVYSLMSGGKRLRPVLTLLTAQCLGADLASALDTACAIECIHTYSLIHDDLPCMDDDDFRRGRETLHKIYKEGHAVLTGDFLLTYAFEIITSDTSLNDSQKVKIIQTLSKQAGAVGMIGGQVLDIDQESKSLDLDMLKTIHQLKTGALIQASVRCGGLIASADEKQDALLNAFASNIGLAFQIVDDILDVTSPEAKHGHRSDEENNKTTYVTLLGLDGAREESERLYSHALEALKGLNGETKPLEDVAKMLVKRNR